MFKAIKPLVYDILKKATRSMVGEWQVQGLGMLRTYITPEIRLHVWDRRLRVPGASPIHTHPWHLESYIVAGVLYQKRFLIPHPDLVNVGLPTYNEATYNEATILCGENAHPLSSVVKIKLHPQLLEVYKEGETYRQENSEIHCSDPVDGTVTIVHRTFTRNRDNAKVYWKGDGPFVSAAPRPATGEEIKNITTYSLDIWFKGFGQ